LFLSLAGDAEAFPMVDRARTETAYTPARLEQGHPKLVPKVRVGDLSANAALIFSTYNEIE